MKKVSFQHFLSLALILLNSLVGFSQNALNNLGLTAANPSEVAFSLRRLSSSYAGSAIQVRRSSDNATQNIGFTVTGDLDQAALLTFVGSGNGFVSIWYDQSGNGRNVTAVAANQPLIVQSGVVLTNTVGRPRVQFNGTSAYLTNGTYVPTTQPVCLLAVWQFTSLSAPGAEICGWGRNSGAGTRYGAWINRTSNTQGNFGVEWQGSALVGQTINANTWYVSNQVLPNANTSSLSQRLNAGNETFSLIGSNTTFNITTAGSEFAVGTIPAARTLGLNGSIQELVLFASTLNLSLLQTLENNQSCYYSTLPAITYNPIVGITAGTTSVNVSYSNAQFNPITYSIAWDAAAIAAGFTNVSDAILPAGNFSVSIPNGAAAGGVYTGTLTVKNDCGTSSAAQTLTISVLNPILGTTQVAQVAYSVRKLSPGYSGPAIRVRRSS
ncbi:MAG: arabinofuranosidase catalytic domain-containing protein, partial [Bacteroidota bacterium]